MRTESEGFLSRWSRLKKQSHDQQSETSQVSDEQVDQSSAEALSLDAEQALQQQAENEPLLTDDDMPPLESLSEDSDFSPFMSEGVSEELRNMALRKLFKHAVFNVTDGLDEYAEDYTSFEKLGDIVTCDMKHQLEMEAKKRLAEAEHSDEIIESADTVFDEHSPEQIELSESSEASADEEQDNNQHDGKQPGHVAAIENNTIQLSEQDQDYEEF